MKTLDLDLFTLDPTLLSIVTCVALAITLALAAIQALRVRPKAAPRGRRAQHPAEPSVVAGTVLTTSITVGAICTGILLALLMTAWMI